MADQLSAALVDNEIVHPPASMPFPSTAPLPPPSSSASSIDSSSPPPPPPPPESVSLPRALFDGASAVGLMVLHGLEYVGEVFADLLGITASRYQYVIDAKEREERRQRMDDAEEEEARQQLELRIKQQQAVHQQALEEGATAASPEVQHNADSTSQAPSQQRTGQPVSAGE